jgi:Bacterial type II/III secretion system short domain
MKRALIALTLLIATAAFAQETKLKSRVFEVHNRDARSLAATLRLLGSGAPAADLSVNEELHTITVRDFPENLATMEDALKRLDVPPAAAPDVEIRMSVLIGSNTPLESAPPAGDDLAPVVKQLQSTLRYSHFGLLTTVVDRTRAGSGIEGSGMADPAVLGAQLPAGDIIGYDYRLRQLAVQDDTIRIESFSFAAHVPYRLNGAATYQTVKFETPVSIRQKEKVVIGTTTMGNKAFIVVVQATIGDSH